ncbi:hypothetical protein [Myxosarcina sp. GI1]|uniref:hypothetical protein n=1 Tax=Myxosarcina sp. GI1 TaxID=1541065 RepID=UPI00055FD5A3|nr:hypothetical protein [Myxosarcina sp. GI1]
MNIKYWQLARTVVLGCCSLGVAFAIGINLFVKDFKNEFVPPLVFKEWKEIEPKFINNLFPYRNRNIQGWRDYAPLTATGDRKRTDNSLVTEVYYVPNYTQGNEKLIQRYRGIAKDMSDKTDTVDNSSRITVVENKLGTYGLSTHDEKMYLNTCMYSQGQTAFSKSQIIALANENMSRRLLPWIFGLEDLRDWDCFWVNISVSLVDINETKAASLLETRLRELNAKSIEAMAP